MPAAPDAATVGVDGVIDGVYIPDVVNLDDPAEVQALTAYALHYWRRGMGHSSPRFPLSIAFPGITGYDPSSPNNARFLPVHQMTTPTMAQIALASMAPAGYFARGLLRRARDLSSDNRSTIAQYVRIWAKRLWDIIGDSSDFVTHTYAPKA